MMRANEDAAHGSEQHDVIAGEGMASADEHESAVDAASTAAEDAILNATDEEVAAMINAAVEERRSKVTDPVERAEVLLTLMYEVSEECLNLARFEDQPTKRSSLVQAGLGAASGWVRMSDVRDKLRAKKIAERP
jgi:hypothetical protein